MDLTLATSVFVTLFVIMDPVGTIPIFLSPTPCAPSSPARAEGYFRPSDWKRACSPVGV